MTTRSLTIISIAFFILTGCANKPLLLPPKVGIKEIQANKITYILPRDAENGSQTLCGLNFSHYSTVNAKLKTEILYSHLTHNGIEVEKKIYDPTESSGVIYTVDTQIASVKPNSIIVTLIPKTKQTYQDGGDSQLLIPDIDIEKYLLTAAISFRFEIDSEYPPEAVKANFARRLKGSKTSIFRLTDEYGEFAVKVDITPYKKGSKIIISTTLYNTKTDRNVIDVVQRVKDVKAEIQKIINS